jgi:two-component system sensor histidine kinase HydH
VLFDRRILLKVTIPLVTVGLAFFAACLIGVWSINRLQSNRAVLLTRNVRSLQAAQEMELRLRQLRLHSLLYVMDPSPTRRATVESAHRQFQEAYLRARESAHLPKEEEILDKIDASYQLYRSALEHTRAHVPLNNAAIGDFLRWADAHPVQHLLDTCEELVRFNRETRAELTLESQTVSKQGRTVLLLAGVLGPIGGLIGGFGVAWGLSRSITRLSVQVRDIHAELDQEVGHIHLASGAELAPLDSRLQDILQRVREVVARMHEQQKEVLRAEQLAAVGQLAASIAHEVRNPLTSIKLLVGAALRSGSAQALTTEDLHVIHNEVGRLERKVQTLLDFTRPVEATRRPIDFRQVVNRSLELVQARLRQQVVQSILDLPESPVCVALDPDQFTGVLVNLCMNALDAMPHGGQLELSLRTGPEESCQLCVADTGSGIAASVAGRLFTPFASTKPTGTGLGLSISRRVVSDHGGTLTGKNRMEGGACFTITLPLHREQKEASHAEAACR